MRESNNFNPHTTRRLYRLSFLVPAVLLIASSCSTAEGEAFGRTGQIVAGIACIVMLVLIYTGWALAIRRLARICKGLRSSDAAVV